MCSYKALVIYSIIPGTPTLRDFCVELGTIMHKWFEFGVHLGIPRHVLKQYEKESDPLSAVVEYWRRGNANEGLPVSWKSIEDTLRQIQESGLANKIKDKYCAGESNIQGWIACYGSKLNQTVQ